MGSGREPGPGGWLGWGSIAVRRSIYYLGSLGVLPALHTLSETQRNRMSRRYAGSWAGGRPGQALPVWARRVETELGQPESPTENQDGTLGVPRGLALCALSGAAEWWVRWSPGQSLNQTIPLPSHIPNPPSPSRAGCLPSSEGITSFRFSPSHILQDDTCSAHGCPVMGRSSFPPAPGALLPQLGSKSTARSPQLTPADPGPSP